MKYFIILTLSILFFTSAAQANPVESAQCTAGGEYGNNVNIKLDRSFDYGNLTIKRQKANYVRDLSTFNGGNYRLDLASQGGITGFTVSYKQKDATEFQIHDGQLDCTVATNTVEETVIEVDIAEQTTVVEKPNTENLEQTAENVVDTPVKQVEGNTQPETASENTN